VGRLSELSNFIDLAVDVTSMTAVGYVDVTPETRLLNEIEEVLTLVDRYLLLCRLDSKRWRLEALVWDLTLRVSSFSSLADHANPASSVSINREHALCLSDLISFAESLHSDPPLSDQEIAHALDGVVVFCVLLSPRAHTSMTFRLTQPNLNS
jgi:hypothetical protein